MPTPTLHSTRAIILAAGQGTRLGYLTQNRPKCMVELHGRPLLHHQLDVLRRCGIADITVVGGYQSDRLNAPGCRIRLNEAFATTNMIHSLFCAEDLFADDLIVCYGDIVYSEEVLNSLIEAEGEILTVVDECWREYWQRRFDDPLKDAETMRIDEAGRILTLGSKPHSLDEIQGQYIGLTRYRAEGLRLLREVYHSCRLDDSCNANAWGSGRPLGRAYMTDLINHLAQIAVVKAVPICRGWVEIDSERDLRLAETEWKWMCE